jgi:hypothetical protein
LAQANTAFRLLRIIKRARLVHLRDVDLITRKKSSANRPNEIADLNRNPDRGDETMLTKSKLILAAALVLGTTSGALADAQFDVDIYRPAVQNNLSAYAQAPAQIRRGNGPTTVKPHTPAEKLWFERASART